MNKKRIISLVVAAALMIQSIWLANPAAVSAAQTEESTNAVMVAPEEADREYVTEDIETTDTAGQTGKSSWVNPFYDDVTPEEIASQSANVSGVDATGIPTYTTTASFANYVKKQLVARNTEFSIYYQVPNMTESKIKALLETSLEKACTITSDAQEGDYLYFHLRYIGQSYSWNSSGATIAWSVIYRTSASQERTMTSGLKSVITSLNLTRCADVERVRKIHDYICKNTTYDNSYTDYTAYGALYGKSAVCQGYATLFYALCKQAGIEVRCVPGMSSGQSHLWNIVKIGSKWYNIDTTWDSHPNSQTDVSYQYFLKSNAQFTNHTRQFSLVGSLSGYDSDAFDTRYPISSTSYAGTVSAPTISSAKSTSATSVKLTWTKVDTASGYYIYRATSRNGTYTRLSTVVGGAVTGANITGVIPGKTYYYKIKAYNNMYSTKKTSRFSAVKSVKPMPTRAAISKLTSSSKSVNVTWKQVIGAKKYEIVVTYKDGKKNITVKKTVKANSQSTQSSKVTGLKTGVTASIKVRAIATGENNKAVAGSYSKIKKIKVK